MSLLMVHCNLFSKVSRFGEFRGITDENESEGISGIAVK